MPLPSELIISLRQVDNLELECTASLLETYSFQEGWGRQGAPCILGRFDWPERSVTGVGEDRQTV